MPAFNNKEFGTPLFGTPDFYRVLYRIYENEQPVHSLKSDEPLTYLLQTFAQLGNDITRDINTLLDQRFVATATGHELELLGNNVGIERKTNEDDQTFRKRVQAGYAAATSAGTYEDIGQVALLVLDADPQNVQVDRAGDTQDPATVVVKADSSIINDSPFTESEIIDLLSQSVVGGHRLDLNRSDGFEWGSSSEGWDTKWA